MEKFDFVILGHGAAAFAGAIRANELGVKTAMIGANVTDGTLIGGTCVNVGCMPSKRMITVGTQYSSVLNSSFEGIKYGGVKIDYKKVVEKKDKLIEKFRREKYAEVLERLENVTYIAGKGRFISKNVVEVDGEKINGKKFLVAVGARSNIIPVSGLDEVDYLTNEEALSLKELPESLCVVGGRTLGLEFAQMFAHFGTKVTILQRSERILPDAEPEISQLLKQYLEEEGITVHTGMTLNSVKKAGKKKSVNFTVGGEAVELEVEHILFATGRRPNTDGLGLEKAGVEQDKKGFIRVNSGMLTSASHIWAGGDVVGEPMLETMAAKEGATAVMNAFKGADKKINYSEVPKAVFTYPEVASVGLTDEVANGKGIKCACGIVSFDLVPKAHIIGDTRGLIKVVTEKGTKRIVGVHILAPHAADLIHEATLAVKFKMTVDDIIDTVHVFPTLSEAFKLAALSFYRDVGGLSCCTE